jgi:hypothetical protein
MPSYIRLLTEQPSHIGTPPLGHTALYASSGTGTESKYELYIKNPEGFVHPVGLFASGGTVSGHSVFNSGATVYSGGYTTSGSPWVALAINGTISGITAQGGNAAGGGVIIQDNLTVTGRSDGSKGAISGVTTIAVGSGHTMDGRSIGTFATVFGKGNNITGLASFGTGLGNVGSGSASFAAGGSGNTASGNYSFAAGSANTASGVMSVGFGATNTASGKLSAAFGFGNSSTADASFTSGSGTSATTNTSFAAGSATTASGKTHFVVGRGNIVSDLFVVGNGTDGNNTTAGGSGAASRSNAFKVSQSGITILSSAGTPTTNKIGVSSVASVSGSQVAALTIYSGSGSHPLGFMMPSISKAPESVPHPRLSGVTAGESQDNNGLMFFDGTHIRIYTGGTNWAKVALWDGTNQKLM